MESNTLKSLFEHVLLSESGRMIVIAQTPFMFAVVNDNGRAALFVRVLLSPSQVVSDGQGFSVKTTRSGNNDYVQITASDRGLPTLFLKLVEYVIERVSATTSVNDGVEMLIRSIEEYRRFIGHRRGRLSEEQVRGTFAELIFLRSIINVGMSAEDVVNAWRGPWAKAGLGVHDFTFAAGRGIEVKATHQPPGTIRVSSPSQLMPSGQLLDLLVLPVENAPDDSHAAIAFRQYAQETAEAIASAGPNTVEKWDTALEALNLDLSDEWYDKYRFLPGEWQRFEVKKGFPHLDIPSLPAGIIDVHYSLELLRLTPFKAPFRDLLSEVKLS